MKKISRITATLSAFTIMISMLITLPLAANAAAVETAGNASQFESALKNVSAGGTIKLTVNISYSKDKWVLSGDSWYYLKSDGKMAENEWIIWKGKSYFLGTGGAMATGWLHKDGVWYYLNSGGDRRENAWILWKDIWYYLKSNGVMAASETIEINGNSYIFNTNGACVNP